MWTASSISFIGDIFSLKGCIQHLYKPVGISDFYLSAGGSDLIFSNTKELCSVNVIESTINIGFGIKLHLPAPKGHCCH